MSSDGRKLGIQVEKRSRAVWRFWRIKVPAKSFIEQERFEIQFRFKNLGPERFPGGNALMYISWPVGTRVRWALRIPELEVNQSDYASFLPEATTTASSEAICSGYGLIFCDRIESQDKRRICLTDFEGTFQFQVGLEPTSVDSVSATTWESLYTRSGLIISAIGLSIVALEKIISFFWWLRFLFRPDP